MAQDPLIIIRIDPAADPIKNHDHIIRGLKKNEILFINWESIKSVDRAIALMLTRVVTGNFAENTT